MQWVTLVWSMVPSASLTLGFIYLYIWARDRRRIDYLLYSITVAALACFAFVEYSLMTARTAEEYAALARWGHLPPFVFIVALAFFIRTHLQAGRWWLLWTFCGLRVLVLVLNFAADVSVNYVAITAVRQIEMWGGASITVADTVPNPMTIVADVSNLVFIVFVLDAAVAVWRRGEWRKALVIPGSTVLFAVLIASHVFLLHRGLVQTPYVLSIGFLLVVLAVGGELSADILKMALMSERLRSREAELAESEKRMELAAEAADLGMWVWDIPRDDIWMTPKGRALFGFHRTEPLHLADILARVHPEDRDHFHAEVREAVDRCDTYQTDFRVALPTGVIRWLGAHGRVECNGSGAAQRMRGVSIDITRRKRAEMEAELNRAEIAHLSRVTVLGELSGSIAHELNQPLAAILSNAQAAQRFLNRDQPDLTELNEILSDIVEQDKHAGEVIHRLRVLLKRGEIQRVPVDVNGLVHDMVNLMRNSFINRGILTELKLETDPPAVLGDPVQLQQVLVNLVLNACDAMADVPVSERRLTVRTERIDAGQVKLCVCDNGCGIAADHMDVIFDAFFTTKPSGMGLGLAVSRTIVTAHGGRVWASHNDGRGICVQLVLPLSGASVT